MLQIRIPPEQPADPEDALGRATVGSRPGMSEQEAWASGRGLYKLDPVRAGAQNEVQIIDHEGIVLAVAKITGISKHRVRYFERHRARYAIEGELLLGDPRVGQPTIMPHRIGSPVRYF
jgi:hypothetical protein